MKARIDIESKEDRRIMAGILTDNGYTVTPGRYLPGGKKAYKYCLVIQREDQSEWEE